MQPKPFSTCCVATDDGGRLRQVKATFGLGDFVQHAFLIPCGHRALARLLPMARGEAEFPGFFTQFKGHKQRPLTCGILLHCGSLWSSWAFSSIVKRFGLWKEAYQQ